METSMAQMAYEALAHPENVMVTHGDTGLTRIQLAIYASRSHGDGRWRDGDL